MAPWPEGKLRKIIKLVQQYPCIWDSSNKYFNNQQVKSMKWKKIGDILKDNEDKCKEEWEKLAEAYRDYLINFENSSGGCLSRGFLLAEEMSFLGKSKRIPFQSVKNTQQSSKEHIIESSSDEENPPMDFVKEKTSKAKILKTKTKRPSNRMKLNIENLSQSQTKWSSEKLEKLVDLVRPHRSLWQKTNSHYHRKPVNMVKWLKISQELGEDNIVNTQKEWKKLIRRYHAFKDSQVPTKSAKQNKRSKVVFFLSKRMSFLDDNKRHATDLIDTIQFWEPDDPEDDAENDSDSENNEHDQNQKIGKNNEDRTGQQEIQQTRRYREHLVNNLGNFLLQITRK